MDSAAASVSVGASPFGGFAAWKSISQAMGVTRVAQPASASASVAKFAIVGVWPPLSGSWMGPPHPPVCRSTKFGTLPAAMLRLSAGPLIAAPSRNCALVQTEATVVISLTATLAGGVAAEHRQKRERRVVAGALVDRGDAALGDQIEARARSGRLVRAERKAPVVRRFRLRQLSRLARAPGP